MPWVWVSVGSNIEREKNVRQAIALLTQAFGRLKISPIYRTPAVGFSGDDFYNLVLGFDTELPPAEVRARLREIENAQGRVRDGRKFAARSLDLDLLTYGGLVDAEQDIPRDEITRYAFVLKPLADIAPDERHPVMGENYAQLWRQMLDGLKDGESLAKVELAFS